MNDLFFDIPLLMYVLGIGKRFDNTLYSKEKY